MPKLSPNPETEYTALKYDAADGEYVFSEDSVEARWDTTGQTIVNTIGADLLAKNEESRQNTTKNTLDQIHVLMNGHVNDVGSSVATKRKIIEMMRLGLEEDLSDPITKEVYDWYLATKDERERGGNKTNGEILDRQLAEMADESGDNTYLDIQEAKAMQSPHFTQVRLAAYLSFNALGLYYRDINIFARVAMKGAKKYGARFQRAAEQSEEQRQNFLDLAKAKGLDDYLDTERTQAILTKLDIQVHDPGTGVIRDLGVQEHPRLRGQANGRTGKVRILEVMTEPESWLTRHSAIHELTHMASAKTQMDEKHISMGFSYPPALTDDFDGTIYNEGMTQSITESLLDEYKDIYTPEVKTMNVIFGSDEEAWDKALNLFFNSEYNPGKEIPIIELIDSILGAGSAREIDSIYSKKGPKAALKHAKQLKQQTLSSV